jgi:hypothetical protein
VKCKFFATRVKKRSEISSVQKKTKALKLILSFTCEFFHFNAETKQAQDLLLFHWFFSFDIAHVGSFPLLGKHTLDVKRVN